MTTKVAAWQRFALLLPPLLLLLLLNRAAEGHRQLDRCTLAREMAALGVPRNQLARWAYLAEIKSSGNTGAVSPQDARGYRYYGLFQMSDEYWCQSIHHPNAPNLCDVPCDKLLSDNIAAAVKCAQHVHSQEGFNPWGCDIQYPRPESIEDCFEENVQQPQINRNFPNRTEDDASARGRRAVPLPGENSLGLAEACTKRQFL